jgi:pimeloyl-ACP methyl ester carboxylesterase
MTTAPVDRAFVRLEGGLVHYRHTAAPESGAKTPLLMAHGGPGSSLGLAPLIAALGADRRVVAPDMMGNGESDPPPIRPTSIAFYADCLCAMMDHLALPEVDLYGHHTGAQVACELAIARPDRVRRVILDGLGLFNDAQRSEYLARYAPEIIPDAQGRALQWVWEFASQITQHFPYYRRDEAHRIQGGAPSPPRAVMQRAADLLKGWSTYHLAYQAAFLHPLAERLSLVTGPTWVLEVERDPLARYAALGAALIPAARRPSGIASLERRDRQSQADGQVLA